MVDKINIDEPLVNYWVKLDSEKSLKFFYCPKVLQKEQENERERKIKKFTSL